MTNDADSAAREQIRTLLDATLFVEASAGTGKTAALVDRYLALVLAGRTVDRIVAITFTEKAAAELRDRIRGELERHLVAQPDPERHQRQKQAKGQQPAGARTEPTARAPYAAPGGSGWLDVGLLLQGSAPEIRSPRQSLDTRPRNRSRKIGVTGPSPVQRPNTRTRIPAMISAIPNTWIRLVFSRKMKIEAMKVNSSSIWPRART